MTALPRAVKAALCVLVMSGFVLTASAQSVSNPGVEDASAGEVVTAQQLAQMLVSPASKERDRAFVLVTHFAYHRSDIDLGPAVPVLVDICRNDPDKTYRFAAVSALHAIGDETGLQQVRQRFVQEPSLTVQYVSVHALLESYGPRAFADDAEAAVLAKNVLARKQEEKRLAEHGRLQLVPRVEVGSLEVVEADSLR